MVDRVRLLGSRSSDFAALLLSWSVLFSRCLVTVSGLPAADLAPGILHPDLALLRITNALASERGQ